MVSKKVLPICVDVPGSAVEKTGPGKRLVRSEVARLMQIGRDCCGSCGSPGRDARWQRVLRKLDVETNAWHVEATFTG